MVCITRGSPPPGPNQYEFQALHGERIMAGLHVITNNGADIAIADAAVASFQASLRGDVLRRGDPGYDDARKVWNGMIDKCPALIARCSGVADVIQAVNLARANDLL